MERIPALIAEAERQHRLFGGQMIDADGRLVHAGFAESEFDRLPSALEPTWKRVDEFWSAVPASDADARRVRVDIDRSISLRSAYRAFGDEASDNTDDPPADGLRAPGTAAREVARIALIRSAAVDNPWSAAFISYLEQRAGVAANEFAFSAAHVDYVAQAVAASIAEADSVPSRSAYRACDLALAPPQPGDLLCATRAGRADVRSFAGLVEALRDRSGGHSAFPMHCDLVVEVDPDRHYLEAVGGNVVQSVTRRRLRLAGNATGLLDDRYAAAAATAASGETTSVEVCDGPAGVLDQDDFDASGEPQARAGQSSAALGLAPPDAASRTERQRCRRPSLNDLSWVVLLQLRP